jgi:hypothetical protein
MTSEEALNRVNTFIAECRTRELPPIQAAWLRGLGAGARLAIAAVEERDDEALFEAARLGFERWFRFINGTSTDGFTDQEDDGHAD